MIPSHLFEIKSSLAILSSRFLLLSSVCNPHQHLHQGCSVSHVAIWLDSFVTSTLFGY